MDWDNKNEIRETQMSGQIYFNQYTQLQMLWSHVYPQMDWSILPEFHMSRIDLMEWQCTNSKAIVVVSHAKISSPYVM